VRGAANSNGEEEGVRQYAWRKETESVNGGLEEEAATNKVIKGC